MNLYDETIHLLQTRPKWLTYKQISTGLCVSIPWLKAFANGKAENASVRTVQKLNDYLKLIKG